MTFQEQALAVVRAACQDDDAHDANWEHVIADALRNAVIAEHNATVLTIQAQLEDAVRVAVLAEREACVLILDKQAACSGAIQGTDATFMRGGQAALRIAARDIRNRSNLCPFNAPGSGE